MMHSSYYISSLNYTMRPFSEPFFVLENHEEALAGKLIADAVADGIRTIVMERGAAGIYYKPCQSVLINGVSYFFVRSLPATLMRWQAIPMTKSGK